jgi:hypothetical protein
MGLQFHTHVKNGIIELPADIKKSIRENMAVTVTIKEDSLNTPTSVLSTLMENPLQTNALRPLSREEANKR